ncbi:energy transducer TonB [Limnohabitans sp. 15K]|uniref:energy transducer TonB n=1 Tax=Limnohabitans sp. 15K TaxID=1100706 RepID=UPI000C1E59AC|nr:energy transducer TonB [Limnohabitans sp. 15K]PIT83217.1 energy transducer TonB [Limnohabitans sp. 15K]
MNSSTYLQPPSKRKLWGVAGVVVLHALLLWAIQAGLHRTVAQKLPTVVQALLLEEKRPEPPPPEPPAKAPPQAPPPKTPPPPAFVPPAEVPALVAPPNAIAAVTANPAPAPAAAPTSAPPTATASPAAPQRTAPATRTAAGVNMAQCDKPEYPSASRRMEEEGTVGLKFLVGADGKVIQSEIEKSSGYKRLDEAARAGLAKCLFRPAMVDGKPEQAWTTIKYVWRLE